MNRQLKQFVKQQQKQLHLQQLKQRRARIRKIDRAIINLGCDIIEEKFGINVKPYIRGIMPLMEMMS